MPHADAGQQGSPEARGDECVTMDCAKRAIGEARWYEDGLQTGCYCEDCLATMERHYPDASITRDPTPPEQEEARGDPEVQMREFAEWAEGKSTESLLGSALYYLYALACGGDESDKHTRFAGDVLRERDRRRETPPDPTPVLPPEQEADRG
jgi:hypothetical protein